LAHPNAPDALLLDTPLYASYHRQAALFVPVQAVFFVLTAFLKDSGCRVTRPPLQDPAFGTPSPDVNSLSDTVTGFGPLL